MTITTGTTTLKEPAPPGLVGEPPPGRTSDDVWVIEPRGRSLRSRVAELWKYRGLFIYFAAQTLRSSYKRTFIGKSWLFLRPLLPLAISTFIFHSVVGIQTQGVPYFLYLLVCMSIWQLFEYTAIISMRSLHSGRRLLSKMYFPRIILPLSSTAYPLLLFGVYVTLIPPTVLFFWLKDGTFYLSLGLHTLLVFPAILMSLLLGLVIGLPCAVIGGEKKDLRFGVRTMMRFWQLLTPVFYPLSLMRGKAEAIAVVNPMTPSVELFRQGLLGTPTDLSILVPSICIALVTLSVGLTAAIWIFLRAESSAVDRI